MRLVFVHGWGFDAGFWNLLSAELADMPQTLVELGFLGNAPFVPEFQEDDILVGHSLGFAWGMLQNTSWNRWVAINSFVRFVDRSEQKACVSQASLRSMRQGLSKDAARTMQSFYATIGAQKPVGTPHVERLDEGLRLLAELDLAVESQGLVLASSNDPLVPPSATELLTKNATLLSHATGGHLLPLREPQWCADAIRDYVRHDKN